MSDAAAAPPAPTPPQPQAFGKYYLLDRLAVGGMAEIFRARTFGEGGFENQLVIKRILAHLSEDENFVRMFVDEAKVTVLLQHPNIVRIYDFGKLRANYFIAMEYVEGKDVKLLLRKLAEKRKLLPPEFAAYVAMEAAKGLDYAHKRTSLEGVALNVVHRDVSPSNVLVAYDGVVKVVDFGIVKASNVVETTDAGTLKGKFEYMSPEQAQGQPLDRRSDVFALGICFHEMLTGRRLFKGESDLATLERIKSGDIPRPRDVNPGVPEALDAIAMRALASRKEDRYADAREMASELLSFFKEPPDVVQQRLVAFLAELFAEEIAREHQRLEEATRLARAMHHSADAVELDEDWEEEGPPSTSTRTGSRTGSGVRGNTSGTGSQVEPAPAPPSRIGAIIGLGVVAVGGVSAAAWLAARDPAERVVERERVVEKIVQAPGASTGGIRLAVGPVPGKVSVDGKPVGEGTSVAASELTPGAHVVRVEAEGMLPFEERVTIVAGVNEKLPVTLRPVAAAPSSRPTPAREAPRVPPPTSTGSGSRPPEERPPPARVAADGTLTVTVSGGWVEIWVDGVKVRNAPFANHPLPEGSHEVRARNPGAGFEQTRRVNIVAGKPTTLGFTVE